MSNTLITLLIVAGGCATSGIAVAAHGGRGSGSGWIVFAIGIVVALAGAVAKLFNPETRAHELKSVVGSMIAEAGDFVESAGTYASGISSFPLFRDAIESLIRQVDGVPKSAPDPDSAERKQRRRSVGRGTST